MTRQSMRSVSAGTLAVAALVLLASGCGTLDNSGSAGENRQPELIIVNIPPDGSEFSVSPTVYWYGTDSDGQIERYDYAVVIASDVDSIAAELPGDASPVEKYINFVLTDQYPKWVSIFVDSVEAGQLPTQQDIRLFASRFPAECDSDYVVIRDERGNPLDTIANPVDCVSDTIPQYFFLRAIDDHGLSSDIKYRTYKRRNHWPETQISVRFSQTSEYISLRQLTPTYRGIEVIWGGRDRLDFVPPSIPFLEYHWRLYGPYPIDPSNPGLAPTLADTMNREPVYESANVDPLVGVWVRDTTVNVYDLWRQADNTPDPLNDTTVTRAAWFMLIVTARDDAYIADETPAVATFKALDPRFERKLIYVDETMYNDAAWYTPSLRPSRPGPSSLNQDFYRNLVKMVYPEADTTQDYWWRSNAVKPGDYCLRSNRCGNFLSLEMLARHRMCIVVDDDIFDQLSPEGGKPGVQAVLRRYLEAGGMVWIIGRNTFAPSTQTCQGCVEQMFDLCTEGPSSYSRLGCDFFGLEGIWYPGFRRNALPPTSSDPGEPAIPVASIDEFIGAELIAPGSGLPPALELDNERLDSAFAPQIVRNLFNTYGFDVVGVPEVNFVVLKDDATPLYIYESWRPGGPIPPGNIQSFMHSKPVVARRVGPDRVTPLYKTAYTTFPLYFIKQEQAEEFFVKMVEWFFLPFSQS